MEVYILDSLYRYDRVVDRFESLVWTERFTAWGDFELDVVSNQETRNLFIPDINISIKESKRVMTVETVEDATDDEGRRILKIKGRTLEKVLEDRLVLSETWGIDPTPKSIYTGTPMDIANQLYEDICVVGTINGFDVIPEITVGSSLYPDDTISPPSSSVTYEIDPVTLYKALQDLCLAYGMGFRIVRDPMTSLLYLDFYMGSDRTTLQTGLAAVVFSPDMDNMQNTRKLTSNALYKNFAYVSSKFFTDLVYGPDTDFSLTGFQRRILFVKAEDIDDPLIADAAPRMIQRGLDALAQQRKFTTLDGEISHRSQYVYDQDYYLGDMVELRDDDGATANMQVTEQIFVCDKEGTRSFPTLSINTFITPGSWLGWDYAMEWVDGGATEYWADQL